jgi:PAS domain S-box-containing protein
LNVQAGAEGVLSLLKDAETGQRGYVITGSTQYLEPYEAALAALPQQIDRLRVLTSDNADQQGRLARLDGLVKRKVDRLRLTIAARQNAGFEAAARGVATGEGKRTMDEIRALAAEIGVEEDRLLSEREALEERRARNALALSLGELAAAIVLLAGAALLTGRAIGERERERAGRTTAEAVAAAVGQSEERLRVTLASIGDAVIATDEQGRVTRLNGVAEALTGWSEAEAIGRPMKDVFIIVNEESGQPVENPVERVLREGVISDLANHTVLVSRDGREIAIDDSAAPIRTADGQMAGVVMVFRDIAEQRRAERERVTLLENERAARKYTETATEQLQLALEAGHMGIWQYSLGSGTVEWSPGLEAIHGYPPGGFPGTFEAFGEEIHPADRELVLGAIGAAVEQRRDHHVEYRIVRSDGAVRWVEGRGQLFCDERGQPERMVGVCLDVTDRKHAEERFRLTVEAAPAAMIMVDSQGTIVLVNALTERLLGYVRDELVGQPIEQLVPSRFRGRHAEYRAGFLADSRQRPMGNGRDLYAVRKDGSEVPVEIGLSPMNTADGRFVLAAVTDISQRKEAEQALQDANRYKDEFLAMLAHELRNPLGAIANAAQLLKQLGPPEGDLRWARDVIDRQAGHLARIVDDLLDVSRISRGQIILRREPIPLASAVSLALETALPLIDSRRQRFASTVPPDPIWVDGDATRLAQVIGNLLSNASRYTAQDGAISLTVQCEAAEAVVRVQDTGIGIAAEVLPRVFDLFVQGERSPDRTRGGLGLGLTLARRLTEMHGGRLEAFSAGLGQGSEFVVRLPLFAGKPPVEIDRRPVLLYETVRRRILVVDDNADAAEALALVLGARGHEVRLVTDGPSAIETAAEFRPEVVLLDIGLPGMDGYVVARRLRAESEPAGITLVALTGYGQDEDRQRARDAGFDYHLVKPIAPDAILALLDPTRPLFGSSRLPG